MENENDIAPNPVEFKVKPSVISSANLLLALEKQTDGLIADIRRDPPDIFRLYGPIDMIFQYGRDVECGFGYLKGQYYFTPEDAEVGVEVMNSKLPDGWPDWRYTVVRSHVDQMSDEKLRTILVKAAIKKAPEWSKVAVEPEAKRQRKIPERCKPVVNAMTNKIVYPEDCTCNFSGSCISYCNLYK